MTVLLRRSTATAAICALMLAAGATAGIAQGIPTGQRAQQPRITVNFQDAPMRDVITTFAEFANRSIVAGPGVDGQVTADIRNQPWDVALQVILASHGLAASELPTGIIRVDKVAALQQLQGSQPLITRTVPVHYVNVDSILGTVRSMVCTLSRAQPVSMDTSQALTFALRNTGGGGQNCRGGVSSNRSTNSLIITAGETVMPGIIQTIGQLDVRTPQVTIAAKIVFIDRSRLEGLGVVYDLKDSQGNQINTLVPGGADANGDGVIGPDEQSSGILVDLGGSSIAALANATARLPSPTLQLVSSLVLNSHSLVTFLDALQSEQLTEVQAHPILTTLDNRSARIQVGEETPVRTIDAGAGGGGGGGGGQGGGTAFPRATVQFKQTGIILEVTPHVVGDQVLLELHAERSAIGLAPSDIGVTFTTQETDSQVLVDDGETVVIGGLTLIQESETRSGIPLLMDIPVLGSLFSTTRTEETKQDLLIMVTPHIIREG